MTKFDSGSFDSEISRLLVIMAKLRDPENGCPWDIEQTFATIAPHTIEEAYEVADAIEHADWPHLQEELGDLLLQVVFHAQMAKDENLFEFNDVAKSIADKMLSRHPHVFGDELIETADQQTVHWEKLKEQERKEKAAQKGDSPPSALDGVSTGLPSMTRAMKLQKRAVRVGFDWPDVNGVLDKIREELAEVEEEVREVNLSQDRIKDEIGDLLFTVVNLARWADVDPDSALRSCNAKFERRFKAMETGVCSTGKEMPQATLEEMESFWQAAKKDEK
ncbi:nucleoside triphosphate pyrophosphohydrolase [Candidatus Terasakiella magnetica]|uniref:Nucleoside triphosphate pyrophosphohydrolase n=1 Tax=Candidatus Terasakiella magnetica TaxID=1867952 RepID=A0A1C3RD25_9PROT|nr:nucleoside triphosphate pyrophosphohydrolase [Candidatus Terasakiella magnetica]SCA55180.1 nucleoside triphosphate pyrophosphohydrolase [Candidatus Terasakiella magnetica]